MVLTSRRISWLALLRKTSMLSLSKQGLLVLSPSLSAHPLSLFHAPQSNSRQASLPSLRREAPAISSIFASARHSSHHHIYTPRPHPHTGDQIKADWRCRVHAPILFVLTSRREYSKGTPNAKFPFSSHLSTHATRLLVMKTFLSRIFQ